MLRITTSLLKQEHVDRLVEAERNLHSVSHEYPADSPVSGNYLSPQPWAWSESMILEAVSRYKAKSICMNDTRGYVAELLVQRQDKRTGRVYSDTRVVGGMIYELGDDCFEVLMLTVDPEVVPEARQADMPCRHDVLDTLLKIVLEKAEESPKRTKVRMHVPDGAYSILKFFMDKKWTYSRVDRYFADGNDAWLVEYEVSRRDGEGDDEETVASELE